MLRIYDTLSREKREFKPLEDNIVKIYVCGPTVYDLTHVGHARTYIAFDIIVRYLKYRGYKVRYVVNITDVEDKIIRKAKEMGIPPSEVARMYEEDFFRVVKELNLLKADVYPRVTEHIKDIIDTIRKLIDLGYAYVVNGNVYFRVRKFEDYGKLSRQRVESMLAGARIEMDERKEDPRDFALWKSAKKGEPYWHSPWGLGRPGWHIECTVMAVKHLGEQIDIHGGGTDLIFPHHENEIAQSEAYTGKKPFSRFWLHTGLLTIKREKMSKSLHNIIPVVEFLKKYSADALRLMVAQAHYRSQIDFSFEKIEELEKTLSRVYGILERLRVTSEFREVKEYREDIEKDFLNRLKTMKREFIEAMDDDFNTPIALSKVFEFIDYYERIVEEGRDRYIRPIHLRSAYETMVELLKDILGFKLEYEQLNRSTLLLLKLIIDVRERLREMKLWNLSDAIRGRLREIGIEVRDTPQGPVWFYRPKLKTQR